MLAVYLPGTLCLTLCIQLPLPTMGRKGGGKKAFLKGVVAKLDADATDQRSPEAGVDLPQPSTSEDATERPDTSSTGPQLPDVRSTTEDLSSESRGQLRQRHKKVCRRPFQWFFTGHVHMYS